MMPFKLLWYIFMLIIIFIFIGLNLGNTSDINLWFSSGAEFKDVPIFVSFFVMYILGAISVIPYIVGSDFKKKKKLKEESKQGNPSQKGLLAKGKKREFKKKKNISETKETNESKDNTVIE